jgi:hypothetical protein
MKKTFSIAFVCLALFTTCKKSDDSSKGDGCMERVFTTSEHLINSADLLTVKSLLSKHGIDHSNFIYNAFSNKTMQASDPPYDQYNFKMLLVGQYVNGLQIFLGSMHFYFKNDSIVLQSGKISNGTTLDTIPELSVRRLRRIFMVDLLRSGINRTSIDGCFRCEFGYYDTNKGRNNTPETLVKAWKISLKPTAGAEYPIAYYKDDDGSLLWFDSGLRLF